MWLVLQQEPRVCGRERRKCAASLSSTPGYTISGFPSFSGTRGGRRASREPYESEAETELDVGTTGRHDGGCRSAEARWRRSATVGPATCVRRPVSPVRPG